MDGETSGNQENTQGQAQEQQQETQGVQEMTGTAAPTSRSKSLSATRRSLPLRPKSPRLPRTPKRRSSCAARLLPSSRHLLTSASILPCSSRDAATLRRPVPSLMTMRATSTSSRQENLGSLPSTRPLGCLTSIVLFLPLVPLWKLLDRVQRVFDELE